jgi:hypothetical protein
VKLRAGRYGLLPSHELVTWPGLRAAWLGALEAQRRAAAARRALEAAAALAPTLEETPR